MKPLRRGSPSLLFVAALATLVSSCAAQTPTTDTELRQREKIALNLAGITDWSSEFPFTDIFKSSRAWISQREGAAWGQGPPIELRTDGYPARLETGTRVDTPILTVGETPVPAGDYTLLYEGEGEIELWNAGRVAAREPGRIVFSPRPGQPTVFLRLQKTKPDNPIRDIRIYWPELNEQTGLFNPQFLEFVRPFGAFRFMDWGRTNNNPLRKWGERPRLEDARYATDEGVPIEVMIELANRMNADAWFCIPHQADDDFIRNYAKLVKEKLHPHLKAYVEYSNEVWNNQFQQARFAQQKGVKLGLAEKPWEAGWRYYAQRTVEMGRIWKEVYADQAGQRLIVVAASQAANPFVSRQILGWKDAHKDVDALAIAPYFGGQFGGRKAMDEIAQWSVEQLLDKLAEEVRGRNHSLIAEQSAIAHQYGLKLLAYEGGQHLAGHGGAENNERLTALFIAANRHPRMAELYKEHLANWFDAGGGLYAVFSSIGRPSKWGSWGLLESLGQPATNAPKYRAVMEFIRATRQRHRRYI